MTTFYSGYQLTGWMFLFPVEYIIAQWLIVTYSIGAIMTLQLFHAAGRSLVMQEMQSVL